jgi:hypothetical protein
MNTSPLQFAKEFSRLKTKLTDLIAMAGGFTEFANLEESRLVRRMSSAAADMEYSRLRQMSRLEMTDEEYDYYRSRARMTAGKITVDFKELFNDHDNRISLMSPLRIFLTEPLLIRQGGNNPQVNKRRKSIEFLFYIDTAHGDTLSREKM